MLICDGQKFRLIKGENLRKLGIEGNSLGLKFLVFPFAGILVVLHRSIDIELLHPLAQGQLGFTDIQEGLG